MPEPQPTSATFPPAVSFADTSSKPVRMTGTRFARIHGALKAEYDLTREALLDITEQDELLSGQPELDRLIRLRMPYVEPLNHVQIELIPRRRAGDEDPRVRAGILLAINGVAAGLRNSG